MVMLLLAVCFLSGELFGTKEALQTPMLDADGTAAHRRLLQLGMAVTNA